MAEGQMTKKVTLFYAGQAFNLPESQADILRGRGDETGTVKLDLGDGTWLTVVLGPGIPAALIEEPVRPARQRRETVL